MADSVRSIFDLGADNYDRARRHLLPCFDDFYGSAIELLWFDREAPIDVLDLGAGTGLLAAFIACRFPHARITLIDVAPEMLARARDRLAAEAHRVSFAVSDYASAPIEDHYDAIVSALSIHHLADDDKRALFARIHAALKEAGIFVNAEQVMGATPATERRNREKWLREVRGAGVSDCDLAAALERMKHDRMAPLDTQLRWLLEAGFRNVDCAYKNGMFAVYSGSK